jgi:hypothetical protein
MNNESIVRARSVFLEERFAQTIGVAIWAALETL